MTTITKRLERLQDVDFCGSEGHWELMTVRDAKHHWPFILEFERKFIAAGKDLHIPLYCTEMHSWSVNGLAFGSLSMLHCHYEKELWPEDWEIIVKIGKEVAAAHLYQSWRGKRQIAWTPEEPEKWYLSGFDEYIGPRRGPDGKFDPPD